MYFTACGVPQIATSPTAGGVDLNGTVSSICTSGKTYTTQTGDKCDSIALANKVSSSTLYYINPALRSCDNITAGLSLCLPPTCDVTYSVKPNDTCVAIGVDQGTTWTNIISWNAGLDSSCSNIVNAQPSWGSIICVTPPGGRFDGRLGNSTVPGNGNSGGQGGSGDGFADAIVSPPNGTVAGGTTQKCGEYIQARAGDDCSKMINGQAVPINLFIQTNPSLESAASCTSKLQNGVWYCLHPIRFWNGTASTM